MYILYFLNVYPGTLPKVVHEIVTDITPKIIPEIDPKSVTEIVKFYGSDRGQDEKNLR